MIGGMQMPAKYYNWVTYSVSAPDLLRINSVLGYFYLERVRSRSGSGHLRFFLSLFIAMLKICL
mgnify:FL=1